MKERPILFNGDVVRAILEGRKTQTRRLVKHGHLYKVENCGASKEEMRDRRNMLVKQLPVDCGDVSIMCPYGKPGDRLWVRETHAFDGLYGTWERNPECVLYRATYDHPTELNDDEYPIWRPSIHMPRWASRITLEIVSVRVERLHHIAPIDALEEGILADSFELNGQRFFRDYRLSDDDASVSPALQSPVDSFMSLWESINGTGSWQQNPWVWVIEFKRVSQ